MPGVSNPVFLSYASEDGAAAERIARALSEAGIEVWFDKDALRGGDAWDQRIRRQIRDCALFVPIISAHTEQRTEGYFRLEWRLAEQRTHLMGRQRSFLVPVCIDGTPEKDADVPDAFVASQWTRLPGGETPEAFVACVKRLLAAQRDVATDGAALPPPAPSSQAQRSRRFKRLGAVVLAAAIVTAAAYYAFLVRSGSIGPTAVAAFAPPPHSIAVLPFTNLSGDPSQEYFSDGMSEELINALSQIDSLQVIARTSSFSFKGQNVDVGTIARKLNVGAILEGSIRRSGSTVRITAQLINAVNGYQLWSRDYDRRLEDVLAVQTDIATTIAHQLRVSLAGNEGAKIETGGTTNPQAYDAYLLGSNLLINADGEQQDRRALVSLDKAVALDPGFAAAQARRSDALIDILVDTQDASIYQATLDQAAKAAETAIALAPEWAEGYKALAAVRISEADFWSAKPAIERALALNPGNAKVQSIASGFYSRTGHHAEAIAAARRAVALDPRNYGARFSLMQSLLLAGQFKEGLAIAQDAASLNPHGMAAKVIPVFYYYLHEPKKAKELCESPSYAGHGTEEHYCLALAYQALGDQARARTELQKFQEVERDSGALEYAEVYAQWGDTEHALEWVERAERLHDPALQSLKVTPSLDPIRNEPRFKAVEKRLNFPP